MYLVRTIVGNEIPSMILNKVTIDDMWGVTSIEVWANPVRDNGGDIMEFRILKGEEVINTVMTEGY